MRWFGDHWGAPICDETQHCDTPIGAYCSHCKRALLAGARGVEMPNLLPNGRWTKIHIHLECVMASVIGSHYKEQ